MLEQESMVGLNDILIVFKSFESFLKFVFVELIFFSFVPKVCATEALILCLLLSAQENCTRCPRFASPLVYNIPVM